MQQVKYNCLLDNKDKTVEELKPLCIYYRTNKTSAYLNNAICKNKCKNPEAMGLEDEINDIIKSKPTTEE